MTTEGPLESRTAHGQKLRAVGQLAGGIAHDFNNLLATILASAEMIQGRPGIDAETREDVAAISEAAERGAALVRQLLAFARRQTLQPRTLAINPAITGLSSLLGRLLGPAIRLSLELGDEELRAQVDPTQFDQLLMNLALNARDAMVAGAAHGGALTIHSGHVTLYRPLARGPETIPPGRYVMIEVRDTGPGIAPEVLPHIFEPFFTTRRDEGGTGLGLATVHGVVRQSGGFVSVDSAPGQGTRFRVYLPRHEGPAVEAPTAVRAADAPKDVGTTGGLVLLVDDEDPVRMVTARALVRDGWRVTQCDSAESALVWLAEQRHEPPAVLVSDVLMPGLDGPGLVAAAREIVPDLPALLVSGYSDERLREVLESEKIVFLAKPYGISALTTALRALVGVGDRSAKTAD